MNTRLFELRNALKMNQMDFGEKVGLSKASISALESGLRNITERHIMLICSTFHVNEHWLRTGEGEMFVHSETFSLDEMAQKYSLSQLEVDIMRGYMELPPSTRKELIAMFDTIYGKHSETAATVEDEIKAELESYRRELEAEKKAKTLSASEKREEKLG